jgi:hypothetical protein
LERNTPTKQNPTSPHKKQTPTKQSKREITNTFIPKVRVKQSLLVIRTQISTKTKKCKLPVISERFWASVF